MDKLFLSFLTKNLYSVSIDKMFGFDNIGKNAGENFGIYLANAINNVPKKLEAQSISSGMNSFRFNIF